MTKTLTLKTTIIGIDSDGEEIEIHPDTYTINEGPDWCFLLVEERSQWLDIREPMGKDYNPWLNELNKMERGY